ncbi:GlsB/YeaQ/YmgE family stress response membrane protein [Luteimonas aquatica]|uniref:GlsB/YeaQ/YmgE family stress response membrane protein n=1 Tax=Luteimonas aquatica TaxID=450364 RepID=UPI001F5602DA|nr:GlsB/YeaQ/YmgE family stress response membrane protein [Luteimonas aquatica]
MGIIIWLVVGGIIGWLASIIMRRDAQQGILLNIIVGIVGSFLGGWLIAPMLGTGTVNSGDFSIMGLVSSLIGAVILLLIVNLFTRGRAR